MCDSLVEGMFAQKGDESAGAYAVCYGSGGGALEQEQVLSIFGADRDNQSSAVA